MSSPSVTSIKAHFTDGYSFRILIDYLKMYHDEGRFIFDSNTIQFKRSNGKGNPDDSKTYRPAEVINEVLINTKELVVYEFNETSPVIIGVDMGTLKNALSDVGKKDSISITMIRGYDSFTIQKLDSNVDSNGIEVKIKQVEDELYDTDEYKRQINDPNFVTPLTDFAKKCKPISTGCEYIYLHQYSKGLRMEKVGAGVSSSRYFNFGKVDDAVISNGTGPKIIIKGMTESKIIEKIKIRAENIKSLAKLNNISQSSNIRFFFEDSGEKPVRISCSIGCYGLIISHLVGI